VTNQRLEELKTHGKAVRQHASWQEDVQMTLLRERIQHEESKDASEDRVDDFETERISGTLRCIDLVLTAVRQFTSVSHYVEIFSDEWVQDDVKVGESAYVAIGMSNFNPNVPVIQKLGNVSIGNGANGFVGIHNGVDHLAHMYAGRR
jgi:hypothetical protein